MLRIPDLFPGFLSIVALASHFHVSPASAQQQTMRFQDLPREVRSHVDEIRRSCKELDADFKPYDAMQGISVIDLNGDGSRDLMVDNEEVCNSHMAGANCSNRGCDLIIWKQAGGVEDGVQRAPPQKIHKPCQRDRALSVDGCLDLCGRSEVQAGPAERIYIRKELRSADYLSERAMVVAANPLSIRRS
jgi:hypothetical protein